MIRRMLEEIRAHVHECIICANPAVGPCIKGHKMLRDLLLEVSRQRGEFLLDRETA